MLYSGGEEIPTAIGPLEVLWTSGHSPGHVCLYSRERKLLFSGDQILENITPNIAWHPGRDMLGDFLESLRRLADLEVDLILPRARRAFFGPPRLDRADHPASSRALRRDSRLDRKVAAHGALLGRRNVAQEAVADQSSFRGV